MEIQKTITTMFMVLALGAISIAAPSVSFSPGGEAPGGWSFDLDTFSFTQQITIDTAADALFGSTVFLPGMTISSYQSIGPNFGLGTLSGGGQFEIRDADGQTVLLAGDLASGSVFSIQQTASLYSDFSADIKITAIDNFCGVESNFLNRLAVGDYLDLTLALTGANFDTMITSSGTGSGSFAGTIAPIPAPGAILLAGIGTSMVGWLRRRRAL